jgi:hypothetical protein
MGNATQPRDKILKMKDSNSIPEIDSVSKFLDYKFQMLYTSDILPGRWMYRGLSEFNYQLTPSVGRLFGKEPFMTKEKLFHFEKSAFNEFRIEVYNDLRENDQFILLAVAQHHGLKTRLLDWTFSPLIALFFAVENNKKFNCDGAFWAYQTQFDFNDFQNKSSPFDESLNDYHYILAPSLSPRIKAQQGIFQLFKDPTREFKEAINLRKFKIPFEKKRLIFRELADLGITYYTLFPDFDGLCKSINYVKLKTHYE